MERIKSFFEPYKDLPRGVYVIFFSKIVNSVGAFVIPLLTIILTDAIGLSSAQAGIYVSISGFLFVPGSILGGKLTDKFGRKKIIVTFGLLASFSYLMCVFVEPSLNLVYLILFAEFFNIITFPAQDSLIGDITDSSNRDGAFSLTYLGRNIGIALGPLIGGFLYHAFFKLIFVGDVITAVLSILLIAFFVTEPEKKDKQADENELEKNMEGSIFKLLKERPYLLLFVVFIFGYYFIYSTLSFILPIQIMDIYDKGAGMYGMLSSFNGLIVVGFTALITKFLLDFRNLSKLTISGLLYFGGVIVFAYSNVLPMFFIGMLVFTLGEIVMSISSMPFVANNTPASHRGRMNSLLPTVFGVGVFAGPLVSGYVIKNFNIRITWFVIGAIALLFAFSMLLLNNYHYKNYYKSIEKSDEKQNVK